MSSAANVITGQIYKELGRLPKNPETGKRYTFQEYAGRLAKGLQLSDVIRGANTL